VYELCRYQNARCKDKNCLRTFRNNVSVPCSRVYAAWFLNMGPTQCPETSLNNQQGTRRNILKIKNTSISGLSYANPINFVTARHPFHRHNCSDINIRTSESLSFELTMAYTPWEFFPKNECAREIEPERNRGSQNYVLYPSQSLRKCVYLELKSLE